MIWFTSDPHFFHKNVIGHCNRPFQNLTEMHEALIKNWNDRVKDGEYVYVLGDFSFANPTLTKKVMDRLKGYKILIKGNHDWPAHKAILAGFDEVHENIFIDLVAQGGKKQRVYLSHFPYHRGFFEYIKWKIVGGYWDTRYNHKRIMNEGEWLLHGHTHQKYKRKEKMIHVGVDAWDFRPVSHHEILKIIEETPQREPFMLRLINHMHRLGLLPKRKTKGKRSNKASS